MASSSAAAAAAGASSEIKGKMITLRSCDGEEFQVEEGVAVQFKAIDVDCTVGVIPLEVKSAILVKVLEYCKKHADTSTDDKAELGAWDKEFMEVVKKDSTDCDWKELFDVINAANYLEIKGLLELTCKTVADGIKSKKPEEVRKIFGITKEDMLDLKEEKAMREENEWAFEPEN